MINAPLPLISRPAEWVCFDLETSDAPAEAVAERVATWKAPSNWRPETVENKRDDYRRHVAEKAALLDDSPIICCAVETDQERLIFNGMDTAPHVVDGWAVIPAGNEQTLLTWLADWINQRTGPETELVGQNIRAFDLPKLRQAYIRYRFGLPITLRPGDGSPPVFDTMHRVKSFSMELRGERYIGLDQVARVLNISRPKAVINGADVPRLYREGHHDTILTYAAIDTATTALAYRLMVGR